MSRLTAQWNQLSRAAWDAAHGEAGASYQQDWAYGSALKGASQGVDVLRGSVTRPDGSLVALAQVTARPFALVGRFALCTHGPVWTGNVTDEEKRAAFRALKTSLPQRWPKLLVFTPDEPVSAGLKGMSRVMTGDATVLVDGRVPARQGLRRHDDRLPVTPRAPARPSRRCSSPSCATSTC